jgi:hypothetical protein
MKRIGKTKLQVIGFKGKELPLSTIVNAIVGADKANKFFYKYKNISASVGSLHQQL